MKFSSEKDPKARSSVKDRVIRVEQRRQHKVYGLGTPGSDTWGVEWTPCWIAPKRGRRMPWFGRTLERGIRSVGLPRLQQINALTIVHWHVGVQFFNDHTPPIADTDGR
jgi:hypothetical protein